MAADKELIRGSEDPDAEPVFDEPDNEGGFTKTTTGFVTQTFDKNGKCTRQEFIAGDQCDYEDMNGERLGEQPETYQSYEMVQPNTEITISVQGGLITDMDIPSGLNDLTLVVKDYDTDGFDDHAHLKEDEGGSFKESRWGTGE